VYRSLRRVGIRVVVLAGLCLALCYGQQGRVPGRGRGSSGRGGNPAADPDAPKGVYPTSHGVLKSISGSQLLVELDDEHEMKFRITRKTKVFSQGKDGAKEIKTSSLEPGQTVDVDMQSALDGAFEAVRITVVPANAEPPK
jgi:hypothetical protein